MPSKKKTAEEKLKHLGRNPFKFMKDKLATFDESAAKATAAFNFKGEESFPSYWVASFYALGKLIVLARLIQMLNWLFNHKESLITQANLHINL